LKMPLVGEIGLFSRDLGMEGARLRVVCADTGGLHRDFEIMLLGVVDEREWTWKDQPELGLP